MRIVLALELPAEPDAVLEALRDPQVMRDAARPVLDYRSLITMGFAAGIGFTVALFFTTAAFPPGPILDEAKMGALLSFVGGPLAIVVGRALGIRRAG